MAINLDKTNEISIHNIYQNFTKLSFHFVRFIKCGEKFHRTHDFLNVILFLSFNKTTYPNQI
jgi:hypothetical protein